MIEELRRSFLARWTPEKYRRLLALLEAECGAPIAFRICETPCFLPAGLMERLTAAGEELIAQLSTPEYRALSERAIPFRTPNEDSKPMFVQVDFGLVRNADGSISPKLVEIQGFPSLYAFQPVLARAYAQAYELDLTVPAYPDLLKRAILGGHDPEHVALLEIDPRNQKTACDFVLTEKLTGVSPVCITQVRKRGDKLFRPDGTPIRRIYNRAIIDEQLRRGIRAEFEWTDALDVEWAGHPNYYFRISKFSLPYLKHETVPRTMFLAEPPEDLHNWVLKPLFSFAGLGVVIAPTPADLPADPADWILQERCEFTPLFDTPEGKAKAEIRVMYIWLDEK
ncbi:MAG: hypothetical protein FJW30_06860, partial [Acidobacteria bacterium]|nr:hypothetical protein [Acidobacteriota bacterium]